MTLRLSLLLLISVVLPTHAAQIFRAGAAVVDVTPTKLPVRTAGSIRETWKSEITDRLNVRCLVMDDGREKVAIATVDTCLMGRQMLDQAKAIATKTTGIPAANMMISATHAHSAPAVHPAHGTEPHPDYRLFLTGKIADAIKAAHENLRPAQVGWGVGKCEEYVFCRRWLMKPGTAFSIPFTDAKTNLAQMNPGNANKNKIRATGPADPSVTVLMVRDRNGRPISVLGNYSTHYAGAPGISADYFGVYADEMAKQLGAPKDFVGLLNNGASGDANCNDVRSEKRKKYDRFIVAKAVVDASMDAIKNMKFHDWVPVRAAEIELGLKVRKPSAAEVAEAKTYLAKNVGDRPIKSWPENYARETVLLAAWDDIHKFKLQAFRVGDFGVAAAPCELYGITGLKIKADSPFTPTMVVGLANGYSGYLPPPDQFQYGGYTTWRARTSMLEHNAEPVIREKLGQLLTQLSVSK